MATNTNHEIRLTLNGREMVLATDPTAPLVHVLRDVAGLTGTKFSCEIGLCGACTVWLDGAPVRSCGLTAADAEGTSIVTIEGIGGTDLHPLQKAWIEEQVAQCGYCQPGMIMQTAALLRDNPDPTRDEIVTELAGNICRCGSYGRIIKAVERAAREMRT